MSQEIIAFGITFLLGALVTALCLLVVFILAKKLEIYIQPSKKFYRESRRSWMDRCGELEEEVRSLNEYINFQSETIKAKQNEIYKLHFKSGQDSTKIKKLEDEAKIHIAIKDKWMESAVEHVRLLDRERKRLHPKYNPNVTRDEKGRYTSIKKVE
jgi:uncharacterized membrane protein YhiD involved in acid resistance